MTTTIRELLDTLDAFIKDGVDLDTPVCLYDGESGENFDVSQVKITTRDHDLDQDDETIVEII